MKVVAVYGSGVGTHPCAGSGWRVRPETHMEQAVFQEVFGVVEDLRKDASPDTFRCVTRENYPEALQVKCVKKGINLRNSEFEYFFPACTTRTVVNPHCGGPPEGALQVAKDFFSACAKLCRKAKYTEAPSAFTQV